MRTKLCIHCGESKPLDAYHVQRVSKDGKSSVCKPCSKKSNAAYRITKSGILTDTYSHQLERSIHRGDPPPSYTKKELAQWSYSQPSFHEVFDRWKASGYAKGKKPSINRLDNYLPYTLDNLEVITSKENYDLGNADRISGKLNKLSCRVFQLSLSGDFIADFHSIAEAYRKTGILNGSISNATTGRSKTAGGFRWILIDKFY